MELHIDRGSSVPLYRQISSEIRGLILSGRLADGVRLPPERTLARALGVNRTTVLSAYRALKDDGLVDGHVGRGTTVTAPPAAGRAPAALQPLPWHQFLRDGSPKARDPLLRNLLELSERDDLISLSVGLPSAELLPIDTLRALQDELMASSGAPALLHSPTEGVSELRETLCSLMAGRGISSEPGEVMVTSGSQQGLDLVARTFLAPGDAVVVEEPSFFGALQVFRAAQARLLGVPVDAEGMRTEVLEALLTRQRVKLVYTLPTYQNPSGAVMSLARRRHLLELAYRFQVPILEDDPYFELHYEGAPPPPLRALDAHGHVLYLSSFYKVLFPGLRVGWLAAPAPALRQLVLVKQAMDLHSTTFGQLLLDRFVRRGHHARHLETVRAEYRRRRDAMDEALRAEAPEGVRWRRPAGGYYFWCRFPERVAQGQLLAAAGQQRVSYLPGDACFPDEPGENWLRLNFTFPRADQIRDGVTRLMRALAAALVRPLPEDHAAEGTRPIV